jgi:predicted dehydrogenase
MSEAVKTGIIGCGNISQAYFDSACRLDDIDIVACADLNTDTARAKAAENGVHALTVDDLLGDPDIGIVINLTIPQAHAEVNRRILEAGKHAHAEKPFATTREDGKSALAMAQSKNLLIGCAPDTFLGGALQTCRKLIDDNWIGRPIAGTAVMACPGHESWHPNPGFYYQVGGGPVFDMAPYYLTALIHLLGPVARVTAMASKPRETRIATSAKAFGKVLPVEVNTHTAGVLEFQSGAIITLLMSFDVRKHSSHPIEIHGTDGSLKVPDPNMFGGDIFVAREAREPWQSVPLTFGNTENFRGIGAADLAVALREKRPNRCAGELAYHVLDIMCALEDSARDGRHVTLESTCDQPAPLPLGLLPGRLQV